MSRYVVDVGVALHIVRENVAIRHDHHLVAPGLIRSQVLATLYEAVKQGQMSEDEGLALNAKFAKLKIRLLGDAVLRRRAWAVASELGWDSTYRAEYVALTQLQADAFVTLDDELAKEVGHLVTIATIADLQ
jgi:predicted nucleic acid-binding protein